MEFTKILASHEALEKRKHITDSQLKKVRKEFDKNINSNTYRDIAIYCGGSLGRGDVGEQSDLDLFILSNKRASEEKRIESLELFSEMIRINKKLGYPQFSNDAEYIEVYSFPDMLDTLGSPTDDNRNLFTVRMLLLLESKLIFNTDLYLAFIDRSIDNYFRDSPGEDHFKPIFLLNDILRYWRTLCLNYEIIRNNPEQPWRKKNINLKFSRMLTIFGTVLPMVAEPATTKEFIRQLVELTPIERFAKGLDIINDTSLKGEFSEWLNHYEEFLSMKENMGEKLELDDVSLGRRADRMASEFSGFIYKALMHSSIDKGLVKYLII
jgi:predicted nucleotidyltransferase